MSVKIKTSISKSVNKIYSDVAYNTALVVQTFAKRIVRRDSGNLSNSIFISPVTTRAKEYSIYSNVEYAAAQEYGRPDMPRYSFTPYLRPAAKEASSRKTQSELLKTAIGKL